MDDMQQAIRDILGNPEKLAEIRAVAEKLGIGAEAPGDAATAQEQTIQPDAQASVHEPRQEALLQALLPDLTPSRRSRLERALRVAKLSKIAGAALQNYGNLFEVGEL